MAKTKASFPIVHNRDFAIIKAHHTAFTVDDAMAQKHQQYGINPQQASGADVNVLPGPATHLIGRDVRIKYAYFHPDFHHCTIAKAVVRAL